MNRPQPTVFISHSTGTLPASDPCVQVKVALVTALEADGWRVFLDSRSVQAGARWRAEILHALAMSQAGIILLNAQSSQSDWVKAEALIMCFRKSIYPDYTVLPVVFPGADLDRTFLKTYEPFEFNEIQRQIVSFADVESADTFAHRLARNPYLQESRLCTIAGAAWIQKVADLFQTVDIAKLGEAAGYFEEFDPDQGPGLPFTPGAQATHLRWALANLMHRSEPQRCLEGVHYLLDQLGEEKSSRFGSFLLSKWVDNESAETLVNAAQNPAKARLLALNTSESEVAKRYAERIRIETPTGMITSIFSVSILNGDYPPEILMGKVEEAICLGLLQYPGNRLLQGKPLNDAVQKHLEREKRFALGMLPKEFLIATVLEQLQERFSRIVFIALTGDDEEIRSRCVAAKGRILKPLLTAAKTDALWQLNADWQNLLAQVFPH